MPIRRLRKDTGYSALDHRRHMPRREGLDSVVVTAINATPVFTTRHPTYYERQRYASPRPTRLIRNQTKPVPFESILSFYRKSAAAPPYR